ncbi:MAG: hypothetical protein PWP28_2544 [Oceanotoga sp.]|uniref:glycosyltransferase n=1 Tax=Oceanotoga sp. TaxID=2108366 RepID=UPI00264AE42A|nr:glycosyltransferase [Oceanotoga sp.]MDN5343664.1 hypothetical protein [Oceanotoga sp.]
MKKILHVSNNLYNGGAEAVFRSNLKILAKDYNNIVFSSFDTEDKKKLNNFLSVYNIKYYKAKNYYEYRFPRNLLNYIYSYNAKNEIKRIIEKEKPDYIHLHDYLFFSPSILDMIIKLKNVFEYKVILTAHNFHLICPNASLFNFSKNKVCIKCILYKKNLIFKENCDYRGKIYSFIKFLRYNKLKRINFEKIDFIISPSYFMKRKLQEFGLKNKIITIRNPIELNSKIIEKEAKENIIIFFGRLTKEKNILKIIESFKSLQNSNYQLLIAGDGPEKDKVLKLIKNSKNIHFLGKLNSKDLEKYLVKSKFSIMASIWYENAPMAIIESINNKVIPLTSNIGGMKELSNYFNCSIRFNPYDVNDITDKIKYAINNYEKIFNEIEWKKISDFSFEKYEKQIREIYHGK